LPDLRLPGCRRPAVEPFVEIELELFLGELDAPHASPREEIHQLAGGEVPHVRPVPGPLDLLMPGRRRRIRVRYVIAGDQHAAFAQTGCLCLQKTEGVDDMVQDEARDGGFEGFGPRELEHGSLVESRARSESRAPLPGAAHHLGGKVDAVNTMPGSEQGFGDKPRPAAGVEDERVRGQRGKRDQPRQRGRIGLHRGPLEAGRLRVEGLCQLGIVRRHPEASYRNRAPGVWSGSCTDHERRSSFAHRRGDPNEIRGRSADLPCAGLVRRMMGAPGAVGRLSRREFSAGDLVRQCLVRIAEREPVVQAWEVLNAEGALAEARRIDALHDRPQLCGLPVGVKDLIDTADLPTAYGSPIHRGHRPSRDAECVRRLRDAGAIVLGKTVTTEFAVYSPGKTRNPRDASRTPGGSSSGSAAAVADAMAPVALGSQTAGSIIRPASYCGVIGYKPTYGLLPLEGVHPLAPSLDTLGLFARWLEDIPPVISALSRAPAMPIRSRRPRLGLCRTEAWPRAAPQTQELIEKTAKALGARDVELGPSFNGLIDAQIAIMGAEAVESLRGAPQSELSAKLREFLREGARVPPERLTAAREQAERCRRELDCLFDDLDALLTPATTGEAPEGLGATGDPVFCRIWTLLGVPCLSLPVLTGPAGLPIGLQIVARRRSDDALLSAATWIDHQIL